jgi:hypothetical protein
MTNLASRRRSGFRFELRDRPSIDSRLPLGLDAREIRERFYVRGNCVGSHYECLRHASNRWLANIRPLEQVLEYPVLGHERSSGDFIDSQVRAGFLAGAVAVSTVPPGNVSMRRMSVLILARWRSVLLG